MKITEQNGSLYMQLQNKSETTSFFELKKPTENNGVYVFKKNEANIGPVIL